METTIILPISRSEYLDDVFRSLELLTCYTTSTNLLCIVDGDASLFVDARNRCTSSKFANRLCVQYPQDGIKLRESNRPGRRRRITSIHNYAKQYINSCQFVFLTEDDTILPRDALRNLLNDYETHPEAGLISGVQLGRHGITSVGAWEADDVHDTRMIRSLLPPTDDKDFLEEIDASGFYAMLTRAEIFMAHEHKSFDINELGPDVYYGLELRKQGYKNYIDWSVPTIHKCNWGDISLENTNLQQVTLTKSDRGWRQKIG